MFSFTKEKYAIYILGVLVIVIVIFVAYKFTKREKYCSEDRPQGAFPGNSYYQYYPPSTKLERQYYTCLLENECLNFVEDDDKVMCLERCRIKSFKGGIPDRVDLVCQNVPSIFKGNCMSNVYSDYRYAS